MEIWCLCMYEHVLCRIIMENEIILAYSLRFPSRSLCIIRRKKRRGETLVININELTNGSRFSALAWAILRRVRACWRALCLKWYSLPLLPDSYEMGRVKKEQPPVRYSFSFSTEMCQVTSAIGSGKKQQHNIRTELDAMFKLLIKVAPIKLDLIVHVVT